MSQAKYALILGGTGFISSFCVDELANAGFNITIITRGRTEDVHRDKVQSRIVARLNTNTIVDVLQNALTTMIAQQNLPSEAQPEKWDLVVDCICYDAAHAKGVVKGLRGRTKLLVHVSTDSIYEVCTPAPQDKLQGYGTPETYDQRLTGPSDDDLTKLDGYGFRKWQAEQVYKAAAKEDSFPVVMLRLPDVLGEREYPRSRHFQYQIRIMLGLPIYLDSDTNGTAGNFSEGDSKVVEDRMKVQRMSFVHAADVGRAALGFYRLVTQAGKPSDWLHSHVFGQGFNLGSKENITMREYLALIADEVQTVLNLSEAIPVFTFNNEDDWKRMYDLQKCVVKSQLHTYSQLSKLYYDNVGPQIVFPDASSTKIQRFWSQPARKLIKMLRFSRNNLDFAFSTAKLLAMLYPSVQHEAPREESKSVVTSNSTSTPFATRFLQPPPALCVELKRVGYAAPLDDSDDDSSSSSDSDSDASSDSEDEVDANDIDSQTVDAREAEADADDLDRCTYLPSVTRGPIDVSRVSQILECVDWRPTPLHDWLRAMTRWYVAAALCDPPVMASDAAYRIRGGVIRRTIMAEKRLHRTATME